MALMANTTGQRHTLSGCFCVGQHRAGVVAIDYDDEIEPMTHSEFETQWDYNVLASTFFSLRWPSSLINCEMRT